MRIQELEKSCGKSIVIEAEEHDGSLAKCNQQMQSPLFSTLPREIRDLVWSFATAPVEDETQKYATNKYYCRPGHRAKHKIYTDLLYTCRRVWLEANTLAMLQAEHCFWYHRAAPDCRSPEWMASLTQMNRHNFGELHLFSQMFAIEGLRDRRGQLRHYFLETPERAGDFQPRMLHVTIRHTDWWWWETEEPLRMQDSWFEAMLNSPDLRSTQTLKLALETLDYKVDQLMPIVERLSRLESREYETHIVDGKPAKTKFVLTGKPEVYVWTGPADIDNESFAPYQDKTTLNYHVITLTWHLRFPEIPRAHVPELRRAPRIGAPATPSPDDASSRYDDPLPEWPRSFWYYERRKPQVDPNSARRISRRAKLRHRRGKPEHESQEEKDARSLHVAQGAQTYLRALQKWQEDARVVGQRNRFERQMAEVRRQTWEATWEGESSLLRFE